MMTVKKTFLFRIKQLILKEKIHFRLTKLKMVSDEEHDIEKLLIASIGIYKGWIFDPPLLDEAKWLDVKSRVPDVSVLIDMFESSKNSLITEGTIRYNKRMLSEVDDYARVFDWLIRPGYYSGEIISELVNKFDSYLIFFLKQVQDPANVDKVNYFKRQLTPLLRNHYSLVESIKALYFR